jgi:hypothetical protein
MFGYTGASQKVMPIVDFGGFFREALSVWQSSAFESD